MNEIERRARRLRQTIGSDDVPPGFDAWQYLALNPDVAAANLDPAAHYRGYGRAELRSLFAPGEGIKHDQSRTISREDGVVWQAVVADRLATTRKSLMDLILRHPRAGWLNTGFVLAAYLQQHQDVADGIDDPLLGAMHYLEFGLEHGNMGRPLHWNPDYVAARYGLVLDEDLSTTKVQAAVLASGVSPLDLALEEAHHWEYAGLCGARLAETFDHEYYHAMASQAGVAPASFSRLDCINHFLSVGKEQALPIHPDLVFAPEFYRETVEPAIAEALRDTALLYEHWLSHGLRAGQAPNLFAWVQDNYGMKIPKALVDQMPVYRLSADLPSDMTSFDAVRHLLTHPRPALSALDLRAPILIEFVVSLADRLTIGGDEDQAEWVYWHALSVDQHHNRSLRHLADLLQRRGRLEIVQSLRRQVQSGDGGIWNALTLAESYIVCQRFEEAAQILATLPPKALADVAVATKRKELAHQLFYRIWNNIGPHVAAYGIAATQAHLRAALAACTPVFSTADISTRIRRVALVGNDDLYQCKLYRIDQKAEQLRAAGFEVQVFAPNLQLDQFRDQIRNFDAVIFFRVPAFPPMIEAIVAAAQQGLLTFYEIDDIVFDTAYFPPPYDTYAGQITEEHYAAMACGVPLFEHAMSLCDYGIASTATIATLMQDKVRTGQVFEHHNALGRLHMAAVRHPPPPKAADAPLVLFYGSGTRAHKEDFHDILEPALAQMLKRYPGKIEIRLIGHFGAFRHFDLEADPVTVMEPVWDFEEFMARVAQADINLSVLVPTMLTDAKSEIKWMEAALYGIPSIVSDTATHREVIEDGVTGFLARNTSDFADTLDRLIGDDALRTQVGQAARDKVLSGYTLEAMGAGLRDMFDTIRPPGPARKRLVVVNVFYPPQAIGGATRVVHDNVTLLREKYGDQFDIDVICTLEGGKTPFEVTTYAQDNVRVWAITTPPQAMGDMEPRDTRMTATFEELIQYLQPDLIHYHCVQRLTAAVVDVARYRDIPYVITLHDGWWISPNQFIIDNDDKAAFYDYGLVGTAALLPRAQALARPLASADRLLAVSESFATLHRDCNLTNVEVVENGVSLLPTPPVIVGHQGKVHLAHIGGASRHKGVHLVRNALLANRYENLELLLIDHAMDPGASLREVWGTTTVTLQGKVPQSEVQQLYERIDILLAPSIWPESYGLVTREAMAQRTWVIAGNRGAIGADIDEDVNGHCIDVSTYQGLAEVLHRVDRDPDRYRNPPPLPDTIRTVADQVDELAALYQTILSEHTST